MSKQKVLIMSAIFAVFVLSCSESHMTQTDRLRESPEKILESDTGKRDTSMSNFNVQTSHVFDDSALSKRLAENNEIVYGTGGAGIKLGDSKQQVVSKLGKPRFEFVYTAPCLYSEWVWVDTIDKGNGLTVYFKDQRVFQIKFADTRLLTRERFTFGTKVSTFLHLYAHREQLESFKLMITDGDFAPDPPEYFVDRKNGVAFKTNHRQGQKVNEIWAIEIFSPGEDYAPNGCLVSQSDFVRVKSAILVFDK